MATVKAKALGTACGLLVSHHAYCYDALLMLPALLLAYEEPHPEWLRTWALVLFTPVPYLSLLSNADLPGHLTVSGYIMGFMGAMGYALWRGGPRERVTLGIHDARAVGGAGGFVCGPSLRHHLLNRFGDKEVP